MRLAAAAKATSIFLNLSIQGSELAELKRARKLEETEIRNRVRQEYETLVTELYGQIQKLKSRFAEFKLSLIEESMEILADVKKEKMQQIIARDYHPEANKVCSSVLSMQKQIDELRVSNNELNQVVQWKLIIGFKNAINERVERHC